MASESNLSLDGRSVNGGRPLKVQKFGGSSIGTVDRLRVIPAMIAESALDYRPVVVVSAPKGVTDLLVHAVDGLPAHGIDVKGTVHALREQFMHLALHALAGRELSRYASAFEGRIRALEAALERARRKEPSPALRDEIIAEGERLAAPLVAGLARQSGLQSEAVDAAGLIRTDSTFGEAVVDEPFSRKLLTDWLAGLPPEAVPVVTGFLGADEHGNTTTLGRGGSDYSASMIGKLLDADTVERWTDVDGIYTDDPRRNGNAKRFARIKLHEANAWNQAGRLGMHPRALEPLAEAGIRLHVRSTFYPEAEGTVVIPETVPLVTASSGRQQGAGYGSSS